MLMKNIIRKKYKAIAITVVLLTLTSCGNMQEWVQQDNQSVSISQQNQEWGILQTEEQNEETEQSAQEPVRQGKESVVTALQGTAYYGYEQLSDADKKLYEEMYVTLSAMEEEITISTTSPDKLNEVFNCIMNDHPELFYVEGYQYTKYSIANVITKITFFGTYSVTYSEAIEYCRMIEEAAAEILAGVPNTGDEYDIIKYLYEYVIGSTEYDIHAKDNQDIRSVLLHGSSVCQGYAKTLQYLLQKCGMEALLVTGFANQEGHAWNLTRVNGEYYYVDPTWGDASYSFSEDSATYTGDIPPNNYDYFLVTTKELEVTHQISGDNGKLPDCTATTDNYYVREGLYVESYSEEQIGLIFEAAYSRNTNYVTIKCSDDIVFRELKTKLIDEQKIFRFVSHDGSSIAYTDNQQQGTLSFWL